MKRRVLSDIFTLAGFAVMATMFTSCAAPVPSPASGGPTARSAVEHASADDCAIIAEIGKSELHWSVTNAPQASFYASFETPGGGSYLEDCEWEKLGLAPPLIGTPNSPMGFFITRPAYSATGASAYFQYSVAPVSAPDGSKLSPFIEQELCTLEKHAEGWHLVRCKMTAIT